MKAPAFDYYRPTSLAEALSLRAEHEDDSVVLAGGQSLMALLNLRLARPAVVIDLGRVPGLDEIHDDDGDLLIGAMVRQRTAERSSLVQRKVPLLSKGLVHVGHVAIRNRGTVCGSIAHADPSAEIPAVAVASEARLIVESARGRRTVDAGDFFRGFLETALEPDELLLAIRFTPPSAERNGTAFHELSRRHGDFALVGVATSVDVGLNGHITSARIVFTGVGTTSVRVKEAEAFLRGRQPNRATCIEAGRMAAQGLTPPSDIHATSQYRRRIAGVLAARALMEASAR